MNFNQVLPTPSRFFNNFPFVMQPIIGHGSSETCLFQQAKETDLYFVEDADVNLASLASSKIVPTHLGCTTVKGKYKELGVTSTSAGHYTGSYRTQQRYSI